jgi:hypothetical protein
MKDPAFLFYTQKFYESTRTMFPMERACYLDLLMYQHQNGEIPNEIGRLLMYCPGVDEATLVATLQAKFVRTETGWINLFMKNVIEEREIFTKNQSESGKIGSFWKKMYSFYPKTKVKILKDFFSKDLIVSIYEDLIFNDRNTFEGSVKRCLSTRDINTDIDIDKIISIIDKGGVGEKEEGGRQEPQQAIIYPFNSEAFLDVWNKWLEYKSKEHRFNYKTIESQQAQLTELANLSNGDQETAISIIRQSVANGWKGLFKLKDKENSQIRQSGSKSTSQPSMSFDQDRALMVKRNTTAV